MLYRGSFLINLKINQIPIVVFKHHTGQNCLQLCLLQTTVRGGTSPGVPQLLHYRVLLLVCLRFFNRNYRGKQRGCGLSSGQSDPKNLVQKAFDNLLVFLLQLQAFAIQRSTFEQATTSKTCYSDQVHSCFCPQSKGNGRFRRCLFGLRMLRLETVRAQWEYWKFGTVHEIGLAVVDELTQGMLVKHGCSCWFRWSRWLPARQQEEQNFVLSTDEQGCGTGRCRMFLSLHNIA